MPAPQACLALDAPGANLDQLLPAGIPAPQLGDDGGLYLRLDAAATAARVALSLKAAAPDIPLRFGISLHAGAEAGWGATNQEARHLALQAQPGEVLASESACDQLVPGLDAEVSVRQGAQGAISYLLGPADAPARDLAHAMPVLMLLPLRVAPGNSCDPLYAELLTYSIQRALAQHKAWRIISRQTTEAFRHRSAQASVTQGICRATHVITGTVSHNGRQLNATLHAMRTDTGAEAWRQVISHPAALARWTENPYGRDALQGLSDALLGAPCEERDMGGLPELDSYRLLFSAMTLMHRRSLLDFERSQRLLHTLAERHPGASEPQAWLAKWHVMRVARRLSPSVVDDTRAAQAAAQRALEGSGDHALALTIDGHVQAYLGRDFAAAEDQLLQALVANPSESLAWLYLSAVHVYQGRGAEAANAAGMAQLLSPLDPMRYYFDSFAAHALLAAGRAQQAAVLAQRSISALPTHVPTYMTLAIARAELDQDALGRQVIEQLRRIEPHYSIALFQDVYPGASAPYGQAWAQHLRRLSLPEGP